MKMMLIQIMMYRKDTLAAIIAKIIYVADNSETIAVEVNNLTLRTTDFYSTLLKCIRMNSFVHKCNCPSVLIYLSSNHSLYPLVTTESRYLADWHTFLSVSSEVMFYE